MAGGLRKHAHEPPPYYRWHYLSQVAATDRWRRPAVLTTPSDSAAAGGLPLTAASQPGSKREQPPRRLRHQNASGVTEGTYRHRHNNTEGNTGTRPMPPKAPAKPSSGKVTHFAPRS
jgi:hypothetical protein